MALAALIVLVVIALFVLLTLWRTIRVIPQARAGVVERLGRYSRTLTPGLALVIPFLDRGRPRRRPAAGARAGAGGPLAPPPRTRTPGLAIVIPFVDRVRPLLDLREQV